MSNNPKFIHIAKCDKFIPTYIDFINERFLTEDHLFLLKKGMSISDLKPHKNVIIRKSGVIGAVRHYVSIIKYVRQENKVIIHSLLDKKIILILYFMPKILPKCYWVLWGHDLYFYQSDNKNYRWRFWEFFRRQVIKNMGHVITCIKGDYQLAQQWYGAKGQYHECFMYTSNLYKEYDVPQKQHAGINILVGNSADPSNNHLDVFDKLEAFKDQDIKIYAPLSYGNSDYAKSIIEQGKQRFGDKFEPLTEHMPFNQYLEFLGKIDVAIFNHKRQQAMGNTITLLGLGKKVFMRNDITPWEFFKNHGIMVYDIEQFTLSDTKNAQTEENKRIIKNYFSEQNFLNQLREIFN